MKAIRVAEVVNRRKTRQSQRKFRQAGEDTADGGERDRQRDGERQTETETEGESKGERELECGVVRRGSHTVTQRL